MQNAFVQLIRLLDHIKDPESPSTRAYVISAVQSRATDLYRYKQRRRAVSLDELEALSVPPAPPDVPGMTLTAPSPCCPPITGRLCFFVISGAFPIKRCAAS